MPSETPSLPSPSLSVPEEILVALRTEGGPGDRAASLLLDAAKVLSDPGQFQAPAEVAQACCRGAVDSVWKMAGDDFFGLEKAKQRVIDQAKALVDRDAKGRQLNTAKLATAVDKLRAEEGNKSGFRIRQIDSLVHQRTRQELGGPERQAVLDSWARLYRVGSAMVHGAQGAGLAEVVERFHEVLAAIRELFLTLPQRALELLALAEAEHPDLKMAGQLAIKTDPRAGAFFFRTAVSGDWLDLLEQVQPQRLLPDSQAWSAYDYLRRQLQANPDRILRWLDEHLAEIVAQGPNAVTMTVSLLHDAGIRACPLLITLMRAEQPVAVDHIGFFAQRIPEAQREEQWLHLVENLFKSNVLTDRDPWLAAQLLQGIVGLAPEPAPEHFDVRVRSALTTILAAALDNASSVWDVAMSNDLREVSVSQADGTGSFAVTALRAALDRARQDAESGVPLGERTRAIHSKLADAPAVRDRLLAVHLLETQPDAADAQEQRDAWWDAAVPLAVAAASQDRPRADVTDFIGLVAESCPARLEEELRDGVRQALGPAPTQAEADAWSEDFSFPDSAVNPRWVTVRTLSPVLPRELLAAWMPAVQALNHHFGEPPARPEPVVKFSAIRFPAYSGLRPEVFAAIAETDGCPAAFAALASAGNPGDDDFARPQVLDSLVRQQPDDWAATPQSILAASTWPPLRTAYLAVMTDAYRQETLPTDTLNAFVEAAYALRTETAGDPAELERLHRQICFVLRLGLERDAAPSSEAEMLDWLTSQVHDWTQPRTDTDARAAVQASGGAALETLIAVGARRAHDTGQEITEALPAVTTCLEAILASGQDHQALAVIGAFLGWITQCSPQWGNAHAGDLYPLDQLWRPAHAWLRHAVPTDAVLMRLDRTQLLNQVTLPEPDPARSKVLAALLSPAAPLGPAPAVLTDLAQQDGGADAISQILAEAAVEVTRSAEDPQVVEQALELWKSALGAGLPPQALVGAGRFAYTPQIPDTDWMELTQRTLEQGSSPDAIHKIVTRAAESPQQPQALRLAALALNAPDAPKDRFHAQMVANVAEELFHATTRTDAPEYELLRHALINTGKVHLAKQATQGTAVQAGSPPSGQS